MTSILDGYAATTVTAQIIDLADRAGLRPRIDRYGVRHGIYRVMINAPGRDGLFGAIYVGAKTGRILRANLTHGNAGQEKRYNGVAEVRAVIKSWAALEGK